MGEVKKLSAANLGLAQGTLAQDGCGAQVTEYRQALVGDLPGIGEVFFVAFAESIQHAGVGPAAQAAIEDLFGLVLAAEPEGLIVAVSEGQVVGYTLATVNAKHMRRRIFEHGGWLRILWRLLTGGYGIGWRTLRVILGDKRSFLRGARMYGGYQARMLSLAVHPNAQGQGIGRELFGAGVGWLRGRGAQAIRLEVRPDNVPARRIYESFGFEPRGEYQDSQSKWMVMTWESLGQSACRKEEREDPRLSS